MLGVQIVRCPNCGNFAEGRLLSDLQLSVSDRVI